ncbi:hypothetical protein [Enhygromyxa salina]|uniref:hypothetical protein n=1 Tax=Enhygromyxa salina TaxID=215803 RepID=UPI001C62A7CF|nr:hypothetical protein [Enhygromyxa salina]
MVDALAPVRALVFWRSRKGHVKHNPRGSSAIVSRALETAIVTNEDDDSIFAESLPDGMRLRVAGQRFRPMAVAKALARMALFVLEPEQRQEVSWLFDWLRGDVAWNPTYAEGFWPGPRTPEVSLVVRTTGRADAPCLVEFGFCNLKYAMRLPTHATALTKSGAALTMIDHGEEDDLKFVRVTGEDMTLDSSMTIDLHGDRQELPVGEPVSELLEIAGFKRD